MTTAHRCSNVQASPFSRWLRENPRLDSRNFSLSATDCDMWVHRFKNLCDGRTERDLQCLMLVEIKTRMKRMDDAQRDTLRLVNAILREGDRAIYRNERGTKFRVRSFGVHCLRMSGDSPQNSVTMLWDDTPVRVEQLESLLLFALHPDSLAPDPLRNHHRPQLIPTLPHIGPHIVRRDS